MTKNKQQEQGPQGTQVFELDEINKMVAKEILEGQSPNADIPAIIGISSGVTGVQYLLEKDKIEIGRRANADISLDDKSVSAMHAHLICQQGEWKVLNLLSSNGTYVNGEKVAEQIVRPGDRIAFGGSEFVFTLVEKPKMQKRSSGMGGIALIGGALIVGLLAVLYFLL